MYYVYAISSTARKYIYVGMTNNLERRINEHQQGQETTTRPYRPFKIILSESHNTRLDAREREKKLKSGYGKEYLKTLI